MTHETLKLYMLTLRSLVLSYREFSLERFLRSLSLFHSQFSHEISMLSRPVPLTILPCRVSTLFPCKVFTLSRSVPLTVLPCGISAFSRCSCDFRVRFLLSLDLFH